MQFYYIILYYLLNHKVFLISIKTTSLFNYQFAYTARLKFIFPDFWFNFNK